MGGKRWDREWKSSRPRKTRQWYLPYLRFPFSPSWLILHFKGKLETIRNFFKNQRIYGICLRKAEGIRRIPPYTLHYSTDKGTIFTLLMSNSLRKLIMLQTYCTFRKFERNFETAEFLYEIWKPFRHKTLGRIFWSETFSGLALVLLKYGVQQYSSIRKNIDLSNNCTLSHMILVLSCKQKLYKYVL